MKKFSFKPLALITFGNFLFALTVNMFIVSNHMGEGGVTGIAIYLQYLANIPISYTYFGINAILLIIGYKYLEKSTIWYTIYSIAAFSIFVSLTAGYSYVFKDTILIPLVGGVLIGAAIGIVLLAGGSTAGVDIIALIINRYFHIPTSLALFIIDLFIIGPSIFLIGFEKTIYTLLMLAISTKVIDYILEGLDPKKEIMIISRHHEEIAQGITDDINRGVTVLHGYGQYTKEEKRVIYVIVSRREMMAVTRLVSSIDPNAFMTISNVHKVLGEGFSFFIQKKQK